MINFDPMGPIFYLNYFYFKWMSMLEIILLISMESYGVFTLDVSGTGTGTGT